MISWCIGGAWIGGGGRGAGDSERIDGEGDRRVSVMWIRSSRTGVSDRCRSRSRSTTLSYRTGDGLRGRMGIRSLVSITLARSRSGGDGDRDRSRSTRRLVLTLSTAPMDGDLSRTILSDLSERMRTSGLRDLGLLCVYTSVSRSLTTMGPASALAP